MPPDRTPPNGEGFVTYAVQPLGGLASGTEVKAQSSIVFDTNSAVPTNIYVNALDTGKPASHVNALPSTENTASFTVSWSGSDTGGPGIASVSLPASAVHSSDRLRALVLMERSSVERSCRHDAVVD